MMMIYVSFILVFYLAICFGKFGAVSKECSAGTINTEGLDLGAKHGGFNDLLNGRVYINLEQSAACNGTVSGWEYCFDPVDCEKTLWLQIGMFRQYPNGTYRLVEGSYYRHRFDKELKEFHCGRITLSEPFTVEKNDVVGICEESDTILYYTRNGSSLLRWDADGCSVSKITSARFGQISTSRDRTFLLSAMITEEDSVESDGGQGLGSGVVSAIVVLVLMVVGCGVGFGGVIAVFLLHKKGEQKLTQNSSGTDSQKDDETINRNSDITPNQEERTACYSLDTSSNQANDTVEISGQQHYYPIHTTSNGAYGSTVIQNQEGRPCRMDVNNTPTHDGTQSPGKEPYYSIPVPKNSTSTRI